MINQVWLNTFCTLVEVGHFTQTAEKLFMTQSGVSQQIKKLESQLQTALLIREGKSFSITPSGDLLYSKGRELLRSFDELEQLIKRDEPFEGRVKIASPGSVGLKLYPYLLNIQEQHTKLVIDHIFAPNKTIEHAIADRSVDIGLLTELSNDSQLTYEKIADEPLVLVTANHIKAITWQQLIDLGFIAHPDAAHHARLLLSKNFKEFEHIEQFENKGASNQISLILEPVSKGFGFTVLPLYAVKAFKQQQSISIHYLKHTVSESLYLCSNRQSIEMSRINYIKSAITDFLNDS